MTDWHSGTRSQDQQPLLINRDPATNHARRRCNLAQTQCPTCLALALPRADWGHFVFMQTWGRGTVLNPPSCLGSSPLFSVSDGRCVMMGGEFNSSTACSPKRHRRVVPATPLEVPGRVLAVAVAVEESQPHFMPDFQGPPPVPPPPSWPKLYPTNPYSRRRIYFVYFGKGGPATPRRRRARPRRIQPSCLHNPRKRLQKCLALLKFPGRGVPDPILAPALPHLSRRRRPSSKPSPNIP